MATVQDILLQKDCAVYTIPASMSVLDATKLMNHHGIGSLLVQDREGHTLGILTERDVLQRVVALEKSPSETTVGSVMTTDILFCRPETPIEEASQIMQQRRIRHLPVLDPSNQLCGLISIGDLNAYHASTQEITIHYLHEYIHGRT